MQLLICILMIVAGLLLVWSSVMRYRREADAQAWIQSEREAIRALDEATRDGPVELPEIKEVSPEEFRRRTAEYWQRRHEEEGD